jgi:hypothetical protein
MQPNYGRVADDMAVVDAVRASMSIPFSLIQLHFLQSQLTSPTAAGWIIYSTPL